jgi:Fe-S-cluster-containing dehydrogenase component
MAKNGLMIEYEYCTGCHTCEVACKQEHMYPVGKGGIHLSEIITELSEGKLRIDYIPFPTAYCDLCPSRIKNHELPACVKHCQSSCIHFGTITELAELMEKTPHGALFTPR